LSKAEKDENDKALKQTHKGNRGFGTVLLITAAAATISREMRTEGIRIVYRWRCTAAFPRRFIRP
jgi:hypothetical protein